MQNKLSTLLPLAALLSLFAVPSDASLVGTSVTGSLTFAADPSNYFDPAYGFVPTTGFLNNSGTTVKISANAVEFGYDDGASRISANFSGTQVTLADLIELSGQRNSFQIVFTDTAFNGKYLVADSDSFPLSGYSLIGDVLTLDYPGGNPTLGQKLSATFTIAPVPEPATLGVTSVSILMALAAFMTRKLRTRWSAC